MRRPSHEATTAQLGALFPAVAPPELRGGGVFVGRDSAGGLFAHDPFGLYRAGVLTNPNLVVLGQLGRGKSAFVKSYLYRHAAFGRRVVVLDPKGEYGPLAKALGCRPLVLRPGGTSRLNPFVHRAADPGEARRHALTVASALGEAALGRRLHAGEHLALELAIEGSIRFGRPTLSRLISGLLEPSERSALVAGSTASAVREDGRGLALELRRYVHGEFAGLLDGEADEGLDTSAPALVIDLSSVYRSDALGPVVACVRAALDVALREETGRQTFVVVDEAWAVLANLGAARFLQSSFKLARAFGVSNVLVAHRISDLAATGGEGSIEARLTEGLLADAETVVCYAQHEQEVAASVRALGLTMTERAILGRLGRGTALWHVGATRHLVHHRLAPGEGHVVDTDRALLGSSVRTR